MPAFSAALLSSTAPAIDPWSVRPIAGMPMSEARWTSGPMRQAPSRIEYSLWTWRWTYGEASVTAGAVYRSGVTELDRGPDLGDGQDQVLEHALVGSVVGVRAPAVLVVEVGNDREVGVPLAQTEVTAERVRAQLREVRRQRRQAAFDRLDLLGGGALLPAEDGDVAQHQPRRRLNATAPAATTASAAPISGSRLRRFGRGGSVNAASRLRSSRRTTCSVTRLPARNTR